MLVDWLLNPTWSGDRWLILNLLERCTLLILRWDLLVRWYNLSWLRRRWHLSYWLCWLRWWFILVLMSLQILVSSE